MSDVEGNRIKQVFFRFACSKNNGLVTLVEPDSENVQEYERRDCETLEDIIWWSTKVEYTQAGDGDD